MFSWKGLVFPLMTVNFYCTTIRPVLEYCAPVFHHTLPAYLNEDIETLYDRRNGLCKQLFDSITINPGHKLYHLLPPRKQSSYNLRCQKLYNLPHSNTERTFQMLFCLCYVPGLYLKLLKFQIRSRSTLL